MEDTAKKVTVEIPMEIPVSEAHRRMKPEVKEKWLKALREPNRRQAQGCLQDDLGQCCLGVLAEVMNVSTKLALFSGKPTTDNRLDFIFTVPPSNDLDAYHVTRADIPPTPWAERVCGFSRDSMMALADMNDTGSSFREIADWIEKNL